MSQWRHAVLSLILFVRVHICVLHLAPHSEPLCNVAFLSGVQSGHEATAAHLAVQPLLAKSVSEFVCLKLQQSQLIKRRNM